jgi:BclA-like protein
MKHLLPYLFLIIVFSFFQISTSAIQTNIRSCPPCPVSGACFAKYDNLLISGVVTTTDLCVTGVAQVNNLVVCGSIFSSGAGVFSFSTLTQTAIPTPSFKNVIFTDNGIINGWTHNLGDSTFTCLVEGNYLIEYDAICRATDSQPTNISIIALANGNEIPGSQGTIALINNNEPLELTRSFIFNFVAGDILIIQFTGGTAFVQLEANSGDSTIPGPPPGIRPAITLTISKIS